MNLFSIQCWGVNLNPARNHGRRHLDWGQGDSDQLWLRINLCSALIGCLSELAFTERCHWPTSSTDLYHRSGSHLCFQSTRKTWGCSMERSALNHVLYTKRLRTFLCSWIWIWRGSSGLGFVKFPAPGHPVLLLSGPTLNVGNKITKS